MTANAETYPEFSAFELAAGPNPLHLTAWFA